MNEHGIALPPELEETDGFTLVGKRCRMSLTDDQTPRLWGSLMSEQTSWPDRSDDILYHVDVYPDLEYFESFNPVRTFDRWACLKPSSSSNQAYDLLEIPAGKYAKFRYKGHPKKAGLAYGYLFNEWLPNSGYELADRPHLALMGSKYINDSDESEEELWIPLR